MQDRPDLLQSEMQGLAFDSLETVFRPNDIKMMMDLEPLAIPTNTRVFIVVDPAAGGPQSEYAIVSIVRVRGTVNVSVFYFSHASMCNSSQRNTKSDMLIVSL